jgi:t-SNARE complex subunit (syntaxin)
MGTQYQKHKFVDEPEVRQNATNWHEPARIQLMQDRAAELQKVQQETLAVHSLLKNLATLTEMQQEAVDRIDLNLTNVKEYVQSAHIQLTKADKKIGRNRSLRILVFVSISFIILLGWMIFSHK